MATCLVLVARLVVPMLMAMCWWVVTIVVVMVVEYNCRYCKNMVIRKLCIQRKRG
jgi:hypothetical protein